MKLTQVDFDPFADEPTLTPVDKEPEFDAPKLVAVDYDPFADTQPEEELSFAGEIGPALKLGTVQAEKGIGRGLEAYGLNLLRKRDQVQSTGGVSDTGYTDPITGKYIDTLALESAKRPQTIARNLHLFPPDAVGKVLNEATDKIRIGAGEELKSTGGKLSAFAEKTIQENPEWQRSPELLNRPWTELLADPKTRGAYLARAIGENTPNLVGGAAAGITGGLIAGPPGVAAGAGLFTSTLETGYSYDDLVQITDEESAAQTAASVGAINAILETLPIGRLMASNPVLRRAVLKSITKEFIDKPFLNRLVSEGLKQATAEGSTEFLQEVVANVGKRVYDENQDLFQGAGESAFIGALLGKSSGVGSVVLEEAVKRLTKPTARASIDQSDFDNKIITDTITSADTVDDVIQTAQDTLTASEIKAEAEAFNAQELSMQAEQLPDEISMPDQAPVSVTPSPMGDISTVETIKRIPESQPLISPESSDLQTAPTGQQQEISQQQAEITPKEAENLATTELTTEERREDPEKRQRVDTLKKKLADLDNRIKSGESSPQLLNDLMQTAQTLHTELTTSAKTGMQNYRAFEDHIGENQNISVLFDDLDDFKTYNTKYSHKGVDDYVLPVVGQIKQEVAAQTGVTAFHRSGDEFLATGTPEQLENYGKEVQNRLANETFYIRLKDGTIVEHKGVGVSYGIGQDEQTAKAASDIQKEQRKAAGLRTGERDVVPVPEQESGVRGNRPQTEESIEYFDSRLKRESHRLRLQEMANQLTRNSGGELIGGDFTEENWNKPRGKETPVQRLPSLNPDWFKLMNTNPETTMSVKDVQRAVEKALAGEKLGVRQQKVIESMLGEMTDERTHPGNLTSAKKELESARNLINVVKKGGNKQTFTRIPDEVWNEWEQEASNRYEESEYDADWSGEARTLFELANDAEKVAQPEEVEAILSKDIPNGEIAKQLIELIGQANERGQQEGTEQVAREPQKQAQAEEAVDLFGKAPVKEQELANAKRAIDEKLKGKKEIPVESGEGDLFSGKSKQKDIGDILYKQTERSDRMSALHNLTGENLIFADKMGGLAVPSIGVVRGDMGIEGMGEITLIAGKELGDPELQPVYDADAYTTTFPRPEYKKVKRADGDKVVEGVKPWADKFEEPSVVWSTWDNLVNTPKPNDIVSEWYRNNAIKAKFLSEEKGIDIKPVMEFKTKRSDPLAEPSLVEYFNNLEENHPDYNGTDPKILKEAAVAFKKSVNAYYEKTEPNSKIRKEFIKSAIENNISNGALHYNMFDRIIRSIEGIGKKKVNRYRTSDKLDKALEPYIPEFKAWVDNSIMSVFPEPRIKVGGRMVPYSLENIVEYMVSKRGSAKEDTLTYGPGKARAEAARKQSTIESMRQWIGDLQQKSDLDEYRKEAEEKLSEWRQNVAEYYTEKDWKGNIDYWNAFDSSMRALAKFTKNRMRRGQNTSAMKSALSSEGFAGVPDSIVEDAIEANRIMMEAPVPYFESKPQRAVNLSEFKGAAIPNDTDQKVIDILDKNGIKYIKYGKRYDEDSRTKAVVKLRNQLSEQGEDVLFKQQYDYSDQAVKDKRSLGVPSKTIDAIVDDFNSKINNPDVNIRVVGKQSELKGLDKPNKYIQAVFDKSTGDVVLVRENFNNANEVKKILRHELLWHHGFSLFDEQTRNDIYDKINATRDDKQYKSTWDQINKDYAEDNENTQAEEFLALLQETEQGRLSKIYHEIMAIIQKALRALGLIDGPISRSEINALLSQVERRATQGGDRTGELAPAYSQENKIGYGNYNRNLTNKEKTKAKDHFKISKPNSSTKRLKTIYRGHASETEFENKERTAGEGFGAYYAGDKKYAAGYGKVKEYDISDIPDNRLVFDTMNDYQEWMQYVKYDVLKYKRASEFEKDFSINNFIYGELGYEGLQIDQGKDAIFVDYRRSLIPETSYSQQEITQLKDDGDVDQVETGKPIKFYYFHNTDSATKYYGKPKAGDRFGRDFEPAGQYINITSEKYSKENRLNLETGTKQFNNPLVIPNDNLGWKKTLSDQYGGKKGKSLSQAIVEDGYDGIITTEDKYISESVDLSSFIENKTTQTKTKAFREWFGDSKVVDENGEPLVVYHGTTHDFDVFTPERGNPENDFGVGYYFTDSQEDVSVNYAGEGPDLTQRIELRAERIDSEEDIGMDEARKRAKQELSGEAPNIMPVYLSFQNPVILGGKETFFDFNEAYDEATDEYGEPEGELINILDAMRWVAVDFDVDVETIIGQIAEQATDNQGISASDLFDIIKNQEPGIYIEDRETGDLANGEFIRRVFEYADYDGVIDNTVDEKFGSSRKIGKSMEGVNPDTAHYIAFKDTQIKSAIGNRGTYDINNPNILYSQKAIKPKNDTQKSFLKKSGLLNEKRNFMGRLIDYKNLGWNNAKQDISHATDTTAQGLFDRFHSIKKAEAEAQGSPLPAEQSGYVAARLSTGLDSVMKAVLSYGAPIWKGNIIQRKHGSKGLLEIFEPIQGELDQFLGWMIARRAKRLMSEGREHNFTEEEINEGLALSEGKENRFEAVAKEYDGFRKAVLDLAEQAGLINPETRPVWDKADHIPFYRMTEEDAIKGPKGGSGLSGQTSGIKALKGGEAALNDPLQNIIMNFTHLIDASMKNHALRQTLVNIHESDYVTRLPPQVGKALVPMSQVKDMLENQGVDTTQLDESVFNGIQKLWSFQAPKDKDVIRVMDGGKAKYFRVNDPMLLQSLTALHDAGLNSIVAKVLRAPKRLLTAGITASPDFMLRNFLRDSVHSWVISEDHFKLGIDSIRGAVDTLRTGDGTIDMLFSGASFLSGYIDGTDPGKTAKSIRRTLRKKGYSLSNQKAFMDTVVDTPAKLWEKYRGIGDALENASREAVYKAALKEGKSKAQAVFEAKDLMDFSMQGSWSAIQWANTAIPFLNARLQGLYKLGRSGALPGPKARRQALMRGISITLASLALFAMNKDNEDYEDLEDWDKDMFWHFFVAGEHFRIPKPFEIGVIFGTVPERAARNVLGVDDNEKTFERLLWNIKEVFAFTPMPQAFTPAVELYANKDTFTGRPIESMSDLNKLPADRYNERTSDIMRWLGQEISNETGVSPKQMEHAWNGYLGTMGAYSLAMADYLFRLGSEAPTRPSTRPDQIPLVKSLYRSNPSFATKYQTEFYDMLTEAQQASGSINAYLKERNQDKAKQILNDYRDQIKTKALLTKSQQRAQEINKKMSDIYRDKKMSKEKKRQEIDKLLEEKNRLFKSAVLSINRSTK